MSKDINELFEELDKILDEGMDDIHALFKKQDDFKKNMKIMHPIFKTLTIEKAIELITVLVNELTPDQIYDALIDANIDHPDALGLDPEPRKMQKLTTPGEDQLDEKKKKKKKKRDACYSKVKSRYKVWPSAYASGALVKCRKVGAKNWGNKSKKKK